jgi:hypothetical protein
MEHQRKHIPAVRRPGIDGNDPAVNSLGLFEETALTQLQGLVEQAADTVTRSQPVPAGIQGAANKAMGN